MDADAFKSQEQNDECLRRLKGKYEEASRLLAAVNREEKEFEGRPTPVAIRYWIEGICRVISSSLGYETDEVVQFEARLDDFLKRLLEIQARGDVEQYKSHLRNVITAQALQLDGIINDLENNVVTEAPSSNYQAVYSAPVQPPGNNAPLRADVYRVFIASPSDVKDERRIAESVIQRWNANHARKGIVLLPVKWETHVRPAMGDRPQEIVNQQALRDCNILVGIFWTKLGSPTGKADSGTVEEITEFDEAGKPVLLYFSENPVSLGETDLSEYQRVKEFKDEFRLKGIYGSYKTLGEFEQKLYDDLNRTIDDLTGNVQQLPASSDIAHTGAPSEPKIEVECSVTYSGQDSRSAFDFSIYLSNTGSERIEDYRLEIEIPAGTLNEAMTYAAEVIAKRSNCHRFFRVLPKTHNNPQIFPGDRMKLFSTTLSIATSDVRLLTQPVTINLFIKDKVSDSLNVSLEKLLLS